MLTIVGKATETSDVQCEGILVPNDISILIENYTAAYIVCNGLTVCTDQKWIDTEVEIVSCAVLSIRVWI